MDSRATLPLLLLLALPGPARAAGETEAGGCASDCYRLGLSLPVLAPGGHFDGESAIGSSEILIGLPDLARGLGIGVVAAFGGPSSWIELRYERTWHTATIGAATSTAVFQAVVIDWKRTFLPDGPVSPFFTLGWVPYVDLVLPRGAVVAGESATARFRRPLRSWEAGVGLEFPLGGYLRLEALIAWRNVSFEEVRWPGADWTYTGSGISARGPRGALSLAAQF